VDSDCLQPPEVDCEQYSDKYPAIFSISYNLKVLIEVIMSNSTCILQFAPQMRYLHISFSRYILKYKAEINCPYAQVEIVECLENFFTAEKTCCFWYSWIRASWHDFYKMTKKVQLYRLIFCSLTVLHVSSDIFAHRQEHLNCNYSSWFYSRVSW
jgi:hypothetical protein